MATTTKTRGTDPQSLGLVPADEEKKRRKKKPAGFDPQALGLEPVDDQPPPETEDDWSPDRLGLLQADEYGAPPPQPAPQEQDPIIEFIDWSIHKGDEFVGVLQDLLGIEHAPPPAHPDMSTVAEPPPKPRPKKIPPGKLTMPGTVEDFLIPDFVEYPARSIYDWMADERTQKSLDAGGYSMVANVDRQIANISMLGRYGKDFVLEVTGLPKNPEADEEWLKFEQGMRKHAEQYGEFAARSRVPEADRTVIDALIEALPQLPVMLAEYGGAGALLGPAGGFAAVDALTHADEGLGGAALAGAKGYALGKYFEWTGILGRELRLPALALAGGGLAYAEGGTDADIAAQAILFPLLALPARSGPVGARYLREHGVVADLRDIGGHIRDLFVGGNVEGSARDLSVAQGALERVQAEHRLELQTELARHIMAESKAKTRAEGETEADVNERIARERAEHDRNVLDMMRRQQQRETPLRQTFETAERRHTRALQPFRTSWQVAPYMRSLHMAERGVLVAHNEGYAAIQAAGREADERFKRAQSEAKALREAEAKTDQDYARNHDMADWLEQEGGRLAYDIRRQVEEEVEARILRAETEAMRRRQELAEIIHRGNKVEGRRALWLGANRDLEDAHRAGIRWIKIGENRARRLIQMGDDFFKRTDARLRRYGITPDKVETKGEYDVEIAHANDIRESYRDLASRELLDAQYKADSRVTLASHRRDHAAEASANAAAPRRQRKPSAKDEETKPEDAKKEDDPDWDPAPQEDPLRQGPEFSLAYKKAIEATRDDPALAEVVKRVDPILENIHDPTDVLPAIGRIAKDLGYKPASTRGVQSAGKRQSLAAKLGMTEKEFLESPYGKAFSDYEIEAAIMLLDRAWLRVQEAYADYRRNPGSQVARQRVIMEITRFLMIRNRLRGAASEAGRSLRMFREVKQRYGGITEADGLTDAELDMIMSSDKAGPAGRIAEKILRGSWFSALVDFYIQGLLSSLQTAWVNVISGLSMLFYKPLQTAVAATLGLGRWAIVGSFKLIFAPFIWIARTLARTGMFGQEYKRKAQQRRSEDEASAAHYSRLRPGPHPDRARFGEVGARFRGIIEAFVPAVIQFAKTWWTGDRYLGETNFGGTNFGFRGPIGRMIERIMPGRLLMAIDDFFKVMMYRSGQRAAAYRQAVAEVENMPVGPKRYVAMRRRYQELAKRPTAQINAEAKREALEGTFQQEPTLLKGSGKILEENPGLKFLVPFRKVLLNTVEFILKGTPAAVLFQKTRMDLMGFNGRYAQDMAWAHMLVFSGGAFIIYQWAMSGNVRESSQDDKARAANMISGIPPLAVRVPGTDQWVTLNRVDPIGGIVALGTAFAQVVKQAKATGDEDSVDKATGMFVSALFTMTLDRSGFRGLADFMTAFSGGSYHNDYKSWSSWVAGLAATITVPQIFAVDARTDDPYLRYARTYMEKLKARTKDRAELWPIRNMWGDPVRAYDSYNSGNETIDYWMNVNSPIYWGSMSKDPATQAMLKLYSIYRWAPGIVQREIAGRKLTDEEYDFYAKRAGNLQYEAMKRIAASEDWQRADQLEKELKKLRKAMPSQFNSANDVEVRKEYREWEKQEKAAAEELRKLRFKLFNKVKRDFAAARKRARLETVGTSEGKTGRFPEFWKRMKRRDPGANPGETPTWYFEAENEQEDWDETQKEEAAQEPTADPNDPYGDWKRWRENDAPRSEPAQGADPNDFWGDKKRWNSPPRP